MYKFFLVYFLQLFFISPSIFAEDFSITSDSLQNLNPSKIKLVIDQTNNDLTNSQSSLTEPYSTLHQNNEKISRDVSYALASVIDPKTGLFPSFPGNINQYPMAYLDDLCVGAHLFFATGQIYKAYSILDRLAEYIDQDAAIAAENADTNDIFGALKIYKDPFSSRTFGVPANGIDTSTDSQYGKTRGDFMFNPSSTALLGATFIKIDTKKYLPQALKLGEFLFALQDPQTGAFPDMDRSPTTVYAKQQCAIYAFFCMLHHATQDTRWKSAAENAIFWLTTHLLIKEEGILRSTYKPNKDFSPLYITNAYTYFLLSPAADELQPEMLKRLTEEMLKRSLWKFSVVIQGSPLQTVMLADNYDALDERIIAARQESHPSGSPALTAQLILALQLNAARLYYADYNTSSLYKAIAEELLSQLRNIYYPIPTTNGRLAMRETAQTTPIPPYGADESAILARNTPPLYYVQSQNTEAIAGSCDSAWIFFPEYLTNPFSLLDNEMYVYKQIPLTDLDQTRAVTLLNFYAQEHFYTEQPTTMPDSEFSPPEPEEYNKRMWIHFAAALTAKNNNDFTGMRYEYGIAQQWAEKTLNNSAWYTLARHENATKASRSHGLINYPDSTTFPKNDNKLHREIWKYPLLNELGAAAWVMAVSEFEMGNYPECKKWITKIVKDFPLHQIAKTTKNADTGAFDLINGYWNAIVAWEKNPDKDYREEKMKTIYFETLKELGLSSALPS